MHANNSSQISVVHRQVTYCTPYRHTGPYVRAISLNDLSLSLSLSLCANTLKRFLDGIEGGMGCRALQLPVLIYSTTIQ